MAWVKFFQSTASVSSFDGQHYRTQIVQNYKAPADVKKYKKPAPKEGEKAEKSDSSKSEDGAKPDEMRAWYAKTFGAVPGMRGSFLAADLPGVNLTFSPTTDAVAPTKGRVLDHVGYEVKDLEAFCARLTAAGVTFDRPYSKNAALGIGLAFFTDPFGTYIELTEGLGAAVKR